MVGAFNLCISLDIYSHSLKNSHFPAFLELGVLPEYSFFQVKERTERLRKRSANKKKHIASRLEEIHIRLEANEHRLQAAQAEAVSPATEGKLPEVLGHCLRALHLECQLRDTQQHVRALKRLCAAQERHAQASEKLVCSLLQTVKKQFFLLQSHNMTTSDMIAGFAEIQQMARHRKEVAWADFSGMSLESDAMTPSSSGTPPPPAPLDKEFEEMLTFPVAQGTMLTRKYFILLMLVFIVYWHSVHWRECCHCCDFAMLNVQ